MADEADKTAQKRARAAFLAKETGICDEDAMTLIELLGMDMGALLREARILKKIKDGR
jgi:hypothetical protein